MPIPLERIEAPVSGHEKTFTLAADNIGDRVVSPGILEHPINLGVGPPEKFRYGLEKPENIYSTWTVGKGGKLEAITEADRGPYHGLNINQGSYTTYFSGPDGRYQERRYATDKDGTNTTEDGFRVTVQDGRISRVVTRDNTTFDLDGSGRISQVSYSLGGEQKVYKPQQQ
jgi:hypothetical protein